MQLGNSLDRNFTRAFEIFSELAALGNPAGQQVVMRLELRVLNFQLRSSEEYYLIKHYNVSSNLPFPWLQAMTSVYCHIQNQTLPLSYYCKCTMFFFFAHVVHIHLPLHPKDKLVIFLNRTKNLLQGLPTVQVVIIYTQ